MFRSYFKIAFRNLTKNKTFSLINIVGLAVGMAVFLLIIQYVAFELSYDSFHENADNIYRVRNDRIYADKHDKSAGCPPALGPTLKQEFPEVLEFARLHGTRYMNNTATYIAGQDRVITHNQEKIYYAEASFLRMFSFPMLKGSAELALEEPFTVIISESSARKYFGNVDPLNKIITITNGYGSQDCTVTGIFKDIPENSHIKFEFLISYKTLISRHTDAEYYWGWNAFNTYILLAKNTNPGSLEKKFPELIEKYKNYNKDYKRAYILQPLQHIHLHSKLRFEPEVNGDTKSVHFLIIIAVFIIILAWINYINLSTSRSVMRAKEVGVRKVLGSHRTQLVKQFIAESLMLNIIAFILAIMLAEFASPYFNELTGKPLTLSLLKDSWTVMASVILIGAFTSGFYPAFVLSSFNPISVLKEKLYRHSKGLNLRKGLVVFQFTVSIIIIATSLIVYRQLAFMLNTDLGMNIDQTLVIKAPQINGFDSYKSRFKNALLSLITIKNIATSSTVPGKDYSNASSGIRPLHSQPEDGTQCFFIDVDEEYFKLYQVQFLAGRNFSKDFSTDNENIILNEEAVKVFGLGEPENALNQQILFGGLGGQIRRTIGIIKNYHHESLKSNIQPVIFNFTNGGRYFSLKIDTRNIKQTMAQIKNTWEEVFTAQPFDYFFLDEIFNTQYKADQQFGKVFALFAFLAIGVSCLGLFGLTSYTTSRRTKEIGIRKVVGATVPNILTMLTKDFIKWVILANFIAWPAAYFTMNRWLQNFAYRIDISLWMFVLAGGIALIIALLTVSWQAIRAAMANPVEALRYE